MEENCENCRYSQPKIEGKGLTCHRRAPLPYNAMVFYVAELIRDIAWNIHIKEVGEPDKHDDVSKEATEADDYVVWPEVERDDFCGEFRKKKHD